MQGTLQYITFDGLIRENWKKLRICLWFAFKIAQPIQLHLGGFGPDWIAGKSQTARMIFFFSIFLGFHSQEVETIETHAFLSLISLATAYVD